VVYSTATCRQRMNANGFNAIWFILPKQTQHQFNISDIYIYLHCYKCLLEKCSLCARWFFLITPDSSFLLLFPCSLLPCLELTVYLPHSLGGLAPSPPSPEPTPFPSVPRQCPAHMSGTLTMHIKNSISRNDIRLERQVTKWQLRTAEAQNGRRHKTA
jgi:hypothetical protein